MPYPLDVHQFAEARVMLGSLVGFGSSILILPAAAAAAAASCRAEGSAFLCFVFP